MKMDLCVGFIKLIFIASFVIAVSSSCSNPAFLANSNWWDDQNLLEFGETNVTGYELPVFGSSTYKNWECFHTEVSGSETILILKVDSVHYLYSLAWRLYLCMKLTKVTDYSYYYYLAAVANYMYGYKRVMAVLDNQDITDPVDRLCVDPSESYYPSENEYHLIVKEGYHEQAGQTCHQDLQAAFSYTISDSENSLTYCGTGNEVWNGLTDTQRLTFDYNACSHPVAYSATGSVICIHNATYGGYVLQTVYNPDEIVDAVKLTCLMFAKETGGNISLSQAPGSCTETQTPYDQPTAADGTVVGLNFVLVPTTLVLPTSIAPTQSTSLYNPGKTAATSFTANISTASLALSAPVSPLAVFPTSTDAVTSNVPVSSGVIITANTDAITSSESFAVTIDTLSYSPVLYTSNIAATTIYSTNTGPEATNLGIQTSTVVLASAVPSYLTSTVQLPVSYASNLVSTSDLVSTAYPAPKATGATNLGIQTGTVAVDSTISSEMASSVELPVSYTSNLVSTSDLVSTAYPVPKATGTTNLGIQSSTAAMAFATSSQIVSTVQLPVVSYTASNLVVTSDLTSSVYSIYTGTGTTNNGLQSSMIASDIDISSAIISKVQTSTSYFVSNSAATSSNSFTGYTMTSVTGTAIQSFQANSAASASSAMPSAVTAAAQTPLSHTSSTASIVSLDSTAIVPTATQGLSSAFSQSVTSSTTAQQNPKKSSGTSARAMGLCVVALATMTRMTLRNLY